MKLQLYIRIDNAAFQDGEVGPEVARIFREAAKKLEGQLIHPGLHVRLSDVNGNFVGAVTVHRTRGPRL